MTYATINNYSNALAKLNVMQCLIGYRHKFGTKKVSEYDQGIPQSQTADNPVAPLGRAAQPS